MSTEETNNIRHITSAKKASLPTFPIRVKQTKCNDGTKRKKDTQSKELQKFIATQVSESIAAATKATDKSFFKRARQYIGLKGLVRTCIWGTIATAGTSIVSVKTYHVISHISYNSHLLRARTSYDEMFLLCHRNKFLDNDQQEDLKNLKKNFNQNKREILYPDSYVLNQFLFGNKISHTQREISDELMGLGAVLTSCSSLKQDTDHLRIKQEKAKKDMFLSLFTRWFPWQQ